MNLADLRELNGAINSALDHLPPADPMTLSGGNAHNAEDPRVREAISAICRARFPLAAARIEDEFFGAGPLEPLFSDPEITEIVVNGRDSIWFEKGGTLHRLDDEFLSELNFRNFIARLSREAGMLASLDCPFADGRWRGCRVHLIIAPAAGASAVLTLRRHPPSPWTFSLLCERSWASREASAAIEKIIAARENFLVVGATGSGKTSVLNACLGEIGSGERAVIIEDADELAAPNPASAKLLTRRDSQGHLREIDQTELLRQALRMRPDRLIMGEIRGGEAKDLLMAFATGHRGCMGTLHADSARQALLRLEMLIQLGAPQWNPGAVRTLILLSLQAIIVVGRDKSGVRKFEGIYRIASLEDVGFLLERVA